MFGWTRNCRRYRKQIQAGPNGNRSPEAAAELEAHAASCPKCRRALDRQRQGDALLRGHFRDLLREARMPERVWEAVSTQLEEPRADGAPKPRPFRPRWWVLVPVSAAAVFALWGLRHRAEQKPAVPPHDRAETVRVRRELAQIRASLQDMETELDTQFPNSR